MLLLGAGLLLAGGLAIGGSYLVAGVSPARTGTSLAVAPGGYGAGGYGMMGGYGAAGPWSAPSSAPGPGQPGFAAGTTAAPRAVRILALPTDRFEPDTVTVQAGETIDFEVTTVGPATHEFMVGPAADVAADRDGTPEIAGIGMMETKSLTYTFNGAGPFAFACHAPGHYEAGMKGTIVVE